MNKLKDEQAQRRTDFGMNTAYIRSRFFSFFNIVEFFQIFRMLVIRSS